MKLTNYQLRLDGASLIDVNPQYGIDNLPDRLPDDLAVTNSELYNLLNCSPGERGRIFEPTFGSLWLHFIDEPIHDLTAKKMEVFMIQSIERWIPQVTLDHTQTRILADLNIPGYVVKLFFNTPFSGSLIHQATFQLNV